MVPGMAESRLQGASEAWSQEKEQGLAGGLMPAPGAGREALSCQAMGQRLQKVPAHGSGWCWDVVVVGYYGPHLSRDQPGAQQGASGESALGQVGPSTSSARNPRLSLGSPSRNDVGGERRPARPEREVRGLSIPGEAGEMLDCLHP